MLANARLARRIHFVVALFSIVYLKTIRLYFNCLNKVFIFLSMDLEINDFT